jgi:hypothetical protein
MPLSNLGFIRGLLGRFLEEAGDVVKEAIPEVKDNEAPQVKEVCKEPQIIEAEGKEIPGA